MKQALENHKRYLLSGVSFAIPFIASGGILIATAIAMAPMKEGGLGIGGPDWENASKLALHLKLLGETAFGLLLPVLAGYIAYAMAGRPGLVAGFVGGTIAAMPQEFQGQTANAGFLGAILIGLIAGHLVIQLKKIPAHKYVKPLMPIIIIPVLSTIIVGSIMLVINLPIAQVMITLYGWLEGMSDGNAIVLALVLGSMIAFDMGGPVNKVAFFFGAAMIEQGNLAIMGCNAVAICTPPLGLGLATLIGKKLWSEEQREAGLAALGMGMIGITEGAIPFAATDPLRVIPCIMLGSMTGAVVAMLSGVGDPAPHGGPIVIFGVDGKLMFVVAIIIGVVVTALAINALKKFTQREGAKP